MPRLNIPESISRPLWNLSGFLFSTFLILALLPFVVSKLGMAGYGTFALINSIVSPLGLMTFGVGPAIIRAISANHSAGKSGDVIEYFRTGLFFSLIFGVLGFILIVLFGPPLFSLAFRNSSTTREVIEISFLLTGLQWFLVQSAGARSCAAVALQKYHLVALGSIIQNITLAAATVLALTTGHGLLGYIASNAFSHFCVGVFWIIISVRLLGKSSFYPKPSSRILKNILSFGGWYSLGEFGRLLSDQTERYLIGVYLGPAAVGIYNIAYRAMTSIYAVVGKLIEVLYPRFSGQSNSPIAERIRSLFLASSIFATLGVTVLGGVIPFAGTLLSLWMGEEAAESGAHLLRFLAIGGVVFLSQGVFYYFLLAIGKSRATGTTIFVLGITILAVASVLIPWLGLAGAGIGYVLSSFTTAILYLLFLRPALRAAFTKYLTYWSCYSLAPVLVGLIFSLGLSFVGFNPSSWPSLIAHYALLSAAIFAATCTSVELLDFHFGLKLSPFRSLLKKIYHLNT